MFSDVFDDASVPKMNNVFICGGHTGYLAGRFFKTTREKPEDISDFFVSNQICIKKVLSLLKSKRPLVNDTIFENAESNAHTQRSYT